MNLLCVFAIDLAQYAIGCTPNFVGGRKLIANEAPIIASNLVPILVCRHMKRRGNFGPTRHLRFGDNAFDVARRLLQEHVRKLRGDVKHGERSAPRSGTPPVASSSEA